MWDEVARLYRETRKRDEHYWTKYVSRPFAAAVVHALSSTRVTPNQVTLLAFLTSLGGAAAMVGWRSWAGLLCAVGIYQVAYILDCADGMLARKRQIASPIGHLMDFLFDEIKAVVFFGAVAVRLCLIHDDALFAMVGVGGVALVSAGLSLTTFTRRPEYPAPQAAAEPADGAGEGGQGGPKPRRSPLRRLIGLVEWGAKQIINYPTYVVYLALVDRIDLYYWAFIGVYLLYTARTFLQVALKLGRFAPASTQTGA